MGLPKFDVTTDKGLAAFNGFMGSRSYIEGWSMSAADTDVVAQFTAIPNSTKYPHAFRWYRHILARQGGGNVVLPVVPAATAAAAAVPVTTASRELPAAAAAAGPAPAAAAAAKKATDDEEDDFDVFGDDEEEEGGDGGSAKAAAASDDAPAEQGKTETRAEMLARLKKEAEERTAIKEAKQRTLVAIEIKPWSIEQDLMALWKKITETVKQDGLKWGESCTLADVAFGIKKIQCTFVMGVNNSSDDVVEEIEKLEDEVQSVEVTSMNVL